MSSLSRASGKAHQLVRNCGCVQLEHIFQQFSLNIVTATKPPLSVLNQHFQSRLVFGTESHLAKVLLRGAALWMNAKGIYTERKEKKNTGQKNEDEKAGNKNQNATWITKWKIRNRFLILVYTPNLPWGKSLNSSNSIFLTGVQLA